MSIGHSIYHLLRGDRWIWLILAFLVLISMLAVYSSSGTFVYQHADASVSSYLMKHFLMIAIGVAAAYFCYKQNYMTYNKLAPILLIVSIVILIYTLIFGAELNDARRWIRIPIVGLSFQPSELAKLALIIFVARAISRRQENIKEFRNAFVPIIVPIGIVCFLIACADLSSAALLFLTCMLMMLVGRVDLRYILLLIVCGMALLGVLIFLGSFLDIIRVDTWTMRIQEFLGNGGDRYQIEQSMIAISQGEWTGVGPGNSVQRNHLPYPYADFIFAIICEEYGLMGGLFVISLFTFLLYRCTCIVTRSPKAFGAMLAIGLCMNLVIQAYANIAVSVDLVPVTGLNLPLISKGGTSMVFASISLGIILSVSRYIDEVRAMNASEQAVYASTD